VAATGDEPSAASEGSPDGPAGRPGAGAPTKSEGPEQTVGRGAIVAPALAPAAEPATASVTTNADGGAGVQRPTLVVPANARPAAAGRLPLPLVLGGVAATCALIGGGIAVGVGERGAHKSSSDSATPTGPPAKDARVRAAAHAVARASVGDVWMASALFLFRAATAARRSSILCARSAGVGGFRLEVPEQTEVVGLAGCRRGWGVGGSTREGFGWMGEYHVPGENGPVDRAFILPPPLTRSAFAGFDHAPLPQAWDQRSDHRRANQAHAARIPPQQTPRTERRGRASGARPSHVYHNAAPRSSRRTRTMFDRESRAMGKEAHGP